MLNGSGSEVCRDPHALGTRMARDEESCYADKTSHVSNRQVKFSSASIGSSSIGTGKAMGKQAQDRFAFKRAHEEKALAMDR